MGDLFGMSAKQCADQGFHVPQIASDGPVVWCRDCGRLIWSGDTPYTPLPTNDEIWRMSRTPERQASIEKGATP